MANFFTLTKKGTDKPQNFQTIDDEMRVCFEIEADEINFLYSWYDNIGLLLACGMSWKEIRNTFHDAPELLLCCDYLETRYNTDSWSNRGK